jgi:hypothetical protein
VPVKSANSGMDDSLSNDRFLSTLSVKLATLTRTPAAQKRRTSGFSCCALWHRFRGSNAAKGKVTPRSALALPASQYSGSAVAVPGAVAAKCFFLGKEPPGRPAAQPLRRGATCRNCLVRAFPGRLRKRHFKNLQKQRRGGRAVQCTRLESEHT